MKNWFIWAVLVSLVVFPGRAGAGEFVVGAEELVGYRIVLPEHADDSTVAVALDVASILREATGVLFPVILDNIPPHGKEIIVGVKNTRLPELGLDGLGRDFAAGEYEIRAAERNLVSSWADRPGATSTGCTAFANGVAEEVSEEFP